MQNKRNLIIGIVFGLSVLATGCSSSDSSSNSSKQSSESTASNSEVKLYSNDSGVYYEQDGTKYYISATEEEIPIDPITGTYDGENGDGYKFTIPDGWFVDLNDGIPVVMQESDQEDTSSATTYMYFSDLEGYFSESYDDISEDTFKEMYDEYVEYGYCDSYEVKEVDQEKIAGFDAKAFELSIMAENEDGESESQGYSKMVLINSDTPTLVYICTDTDETNIELIKETSEQIFDTLEISTVEADGDTDEDTEEIVIEDGEE